MPVLGAAGVALISVGTALNSPSWLAVASMAVVGFAVLFSGAISSTINAATQAALLAYILAVLLPASAADLPARLGGWFLALAVSVPVAVFVWPPDEQDVLRQRSAQLCRALAGMLALEQPPPGTGDSLVAMRRALTGLRDAFRASATRPAAVSTGTRLLIRLVDELEWLTTTVANACANAPEQWPEQGRRLRESSARAMAACASVLDHDGTGPTRTARIGLDERLADLDDARAAVSAEALAELRTSAELVADGPVSGEFERPLYAAHELGYAVALATRTIAMIAAADSRSWWVRLAGRRLDVDEVGPVVGAQRVAAGHFDRHSVWLQNSVRGAAGLTLAVLFARLFDAQNAFWIGLGALSVLRSTALSTGATIFRALAGTAVGFAIGAAIVSVLGTGHALLWSLLPLVILVAAYAPALRSFVAGQAAFTVFSIILFNLIVPSGWQVGVLRIEDVALGCLASLVAGFLFWPRGAGPALGGALAEAYRASADYLQESVGYLTGRVGAVNAGSEAAAAGLRMDDALRQYLAERGTKEVDLRSVVLLANGATRLRLAGTAIGCICGRVPFKGPFAIGHECVAQVLAVGSDVQRVRVGQTVVVPWAVSCGTCEPCRRGLTSKCATTTSATLAAYGFGPASGPWGGMVADELRVPFADHMLVAVPADVPPLRVAAASDNLADAWRSVVTPLRERPGGSVLIIGGGAQSIGLYAAGLAVCARRRASCITSTTTPCVARSPRRSARTRSPLGHARAAGAHRPL